MSASTTRRRSTVHDFSTLRLHPDGTRVQINSPTRTGLHDSRTRDTGRDIRGNRVARDAAGHGVVPKRAVMREDDNDEVHNARPRVPRRRKRGRIDDDQVEFLGASGSGAHRHITTSMGGGATTIDANGKGEMMNWPMPSSVRPGRAFIFSLSLHATTHHSFLLCFVMQDLLKCVHHFASQYYSARGLLADRSREYRREVRQQAAKRVLAQAASGGAAYAGPGTNADTAADDPFTGDEEDDEIDYEKDDCHDGVIKDRGVGEGKGTPSEDVPDMYRAFDGSALMAIGTSVPSQIVIATQSRMKELSPGMLLQEHTSMLLKLNIPLGWTKELEAAGIVPEDRSAGLDNDNTDDVESEKPDEE
jgi:hypothetical protein